MSEKLITSDPAGYHMPSHIRQYVMMLEAQWEHSKEGGVTGRKIAADFINVLWDAGWRPPKVIPIDDLGGSDVSK